MRMVFLACCIMLGAILLALGLPRFAASLTRAPANQAVGLASAGHDLRPQAYERAARALERSLDFLDHRRAHVDLTIIEQNIGRQLHEDDERREQSYAVALDALRASMRYSPVEPTGWLLAAQMYYDQGDREAAARALTWSLRTGAYLRHQVHPRAFLAIGLWELLEEETRQRLMDSIAAAFAAAPDIFTSWAVTFEVEDDLLPRFYRYDRENDQYVRPHRYPEHGINPYYGINRDFEGEEGLAKRFIAAVDKYNESLRAELAARENPPMASSRGALLPLFVRQSIAAASLLVTASVPSFGEAMTIEDYLSATRDAASAEDEALLNEYLSGVLDGLVMLGALSGEGGSTLFCLPRDAVINLDVAIFRRDLDAMLARFVQEVPNFDELARNRTVGLAALQLMTMRHPCEG